MSAINAYFENLRKVIDAVETVIPNDADPPDSPESVRRAAMRAFSARLADGVGRARLPDLLYFADDIVASGALPALLYHGVHIPQDVKVVTIANRGNEPVLPISLARVSFDPFAAGRTIAAAVLSWLETGRFPKDVSFEDSFVPGESFPGGTSGEGSR